MHKKKGRITRIVSALSLLTGLSLSTGLLGCTTTNRTYYQAMWRDESTFQGIKTESEKDKFRYGFGVEVMDTEKDNLPSENEKIPVIGEVNYQGKVKHHQVNLVPELSYSAYDFRGRLLGIDSGLEARLGIGTELQIKVDTYKYNLQTSDDDYSIDGPLSSIDPDVNLFLSGQTNIDFWYLSTFLQIRFDQNKDLTLLGGAGIKW